MDLLLGLILGFLFLFPAGVTVGYFGCRWLDRNYPKEGQ